MKYLWWIEILTPEQLSIFHLNIRSLHQNYQKYSHIFIFLGKEIIYLTTYSTHFIDGYMASFPWEAAVSVEINKLLICFCNFVLSCPTLEIDIFI